jgi:hypothetical protein
VDWLVLSIVLSLVLTLVLNLAVRLFPGGARRTAHWLDQRRPDDLDDRHESRRRVRIIVPWKAMIAVSIVLTVVLNVLLWTR